MRLAHVILAALASVLLALPSHSANTWGTDLSDLWVNDSEPGWGVNISHQGDMMFVTFFVYGPDGRAKWYVASGMRSRGGGSPFVFDGDLYETIGPYFGGFFNPSAVGYRRVGTVTFNAQFISQGTLTYSVDGVFVTKTINRYLFRYNNLSGSYHASIAGTASGCLINGYVEASVDLSVTHSSNNFVSMTFSLANGASCTMSGNYSQQGRMGRILGSISCSNGSPGTFDGVEIEAGRTGFFIRYSSNYGNGCTEAARIAANRRE